LDIRNWFGYSELAWIFRVFQVPSSPALLFGLAGAAQKAQAIHGNSPSEAAISRWDYGKTASRRSFSVYAFHRRCSPHCWTAKVIE